MASSSSSSTPSPTVTVAGLPQMRWLNGLVGDASQNGDILTMKTGEKTDWFNPPPDPSAPEGLSNAPALVFTAPPGDWQLSAKVSVDHKYLFDAATIFVHRDANEWCKLCFEYSPENKPLIVSVVTRDISDDCNGSVVEGGAVHMRVSKYGWSENGAPIMAFHYSTDGGRYWTLHRAFCMRPPPQKSGVASTSSELAIGFLAQCPTGEACTAMFSDIKYTQSALTDLRDGS